jgi:Fe-S oxidoreductase
VYFPFSKHFHIFASPTKYLVARRASSGVLPAEDLDLEAENLKAGADKLEDLAWPRLLDAYACIQCNRCQDVCPATATGKALSPSALEINKRMELNSLHPGEASPRPLLTFALSPEAAWACTTCGACMEVCPVQDEPMLDIIDIRRNQVMIQGEFPAQLQTAFRGMERASNPWGINRDKRMDWAEGLNVKTIEENPQPDVLYWVGCAASYDPQSQKTARAFVQLLDHAGVNFAVLGRKECCTGDSARRAGNELLYQQLASQNIATLNQLKPALIVATCPHCMNAVGKEYGQLGANFKTVHHTEYLETLVAQGKLLTAPETATVAYHDPCYLGRHNGVYEAPRNLLNILSSEQVELGRNRENSFCCGAGGAQFWKEEEAGTQKISDNRYREAQQALGGSENKVLAVGCPFCKSMLESTAARGLQDAIAVKDVAELLLESVEKKLGKIRPAEAANPANLPSPQPMATVAAAEKAPDVSAIKEATTAAEPAPPVERKKWQPKAGTTAPTPSEPPPVKRKAWTPKAAASKEEQPKPEDEKSSDA